MNEEQKILRFNEMLDLTLGISPGIEPSPELDGEETDELMALASALAHEDFEDEILPFQSVQKKPIRSARLGGVGSRRLLGSRFAFALLVVVALLVVGLLGVGPEKALAALGRLLGYVPDVGFVEEGAVLRAIPEPVVQDREGVRLVVEKAVADAERTIILIEVNGLSLVAANSQGEAVPMGPQPSLRLPDGSTLDPGQGGGEGWGSGYNERLVFPALPLEVEIVTLQIPRLRDMPAGTAPENWEIELRFVPAPPDLVVMPVIELETPTPTSQAALDDEETEPPLHGISLHAERFVALEDGYLILGSLRWDDRYPAGYGAYGTWDMFLEDSEGREIPIEIAEPDDAEVGPYRTPWAFRVFGTSIHTPLTLTLRSTEVRLSQPVSFEFDPGTNPQAGQEWDLEQEIEVLGYPVKILSAQFIERRGMRGFSLEIQPDPMIASLQMDLTGVDGVPLGSGGGGGGGPTDSGGILNEMLTNGNISGPILFNVHSVGLRGPWITSWAPTGTEEQDRSPTSMPEACLSPDQLKEFPGVDSYLPLQDFPSRVVVYGPAGDSDAYVIYIANPYGSDRQVIGEGTWAAVSPDGSQIVYSARDGLNLVDLSTGGTTHLSGTVEGDYSALWSPDGLRIAFVRVVDLNLYLINADGTGLRQVTSGVEYELLSGWAPDGAKLYYSIGSEDGQLLRIIDLATRAVTDLFTVGPKDVPTISPDGNWVAYADRYGLHVSSLDRSNQHLLAQADLLFSGHLWSPDGKWLLTSISDADQAFPVPTPVMIHVDTCQAIRLTGLSGYLQGWLP
jgi:hypothetical protein